ncbi:hypothetical protein [Litoreibacter albidus]
MPQPMEDRRVSGYLKAFAAADTNVAYGPDAAIYRVIPKVDFVRDL